MNTTETPVYRHLFFDLDDTFWDVRTNQKAAQEVMFGQFGMGDHFPDFETYYTIFRQINQQLWDQYRDGIVDQKTLRNGRFARLLEAGGIRDENLAEVMSDEYLRIVPGFNALMPHSVEVLDYLQEKGYPMSLITNGFNGTQHHKVEYSGIAKYFGRIVTSEFAGVNKPNPGIFEYAMRKEGIARASECIMIGDDLYNDVYGATSVGMPSVFVNIHGVEHDQQPTYEIKNLLGLKEIF